MTDTNAPELIRLAAKAAGINALIDPHGVWRNCTDSHPARNIFAAPTWNPLTDDGDALRLAVKLELDVMCASVCSFDYAITVTIEAGTEPYAATRRAITRAAAAIGKNMP